MTWPDLRSAVSAEVLKARRSRVPVATLLILAAAPLAGALFVYIAEDPGRARRLGIIGAKAELSGITPDWSGLLGFATQVAAAGSLVINAFLLTWLFGREFVDHTARYLMALPVSRSAIVVAKLAVYLAWATVLVVWLAAVTIVIGAAMRLPGGSMELIGDWVGAILRAGLLTILTAAPVAYVASRTRGYLAPLATALGLVVVATFGAALGWAGVIPWAVPAAAAGIAPGQPATPLSLVLVAATGAIGVAVTVRWWRGPDAGLSA